MILYKESPLLSAVLEWVCPTPPPRPGVASSQGGPELLPQVLGQLPCRLPPRPRPAHPDGPRTGERAHVLVRRHADEDGREGRWVGQGEGQE